MNISYKKLRFKLCLILCLLWSPTIMADMSLFTIVPILGHLAQGKNHPIFKDFNVGFGGASNFAFTSIESGKKIWVSSKDLILNTNISDNSYYAQIKNFNGGSFQTLQSHLQKSKFFTIWITRGWQDSWYNLSDIQSLMDAGYIPVFNYWFFGDGLGGSFPDAGKIAEYRVDTARVATLLGQLKGTKMLIMEPEFNKDTVMASTSTQSSFANIIIEAIDTIRAKSPSNLLVSLCMTDQGNP
ncbi:MAG: hypothetical protein Q9M36_00145 [Sulfurovum sp.]|nr:hypothetical protein [Sulfurovum sp.]